MAARLPTNVRRAAHRRVDAIPCFGHAAALNLAKKPGKTMSIRAFKQAADESGRAALPVDTGSFIPRKAIARQFGSFLLFVAATIGVATSAFAGDPNVISTVTAVPSIVTYSRPEESPPLITYAAYEISVVNNSTNTLNNVRVVGSTSVAGSTQAAPFVASIGLGCVTTNMSATAIECSIGQLRGGGGSSSFVVVFQAPTEGASVDFAWTVYYAEGSNDNGAHADTNSGTTSTALGTPVATELKTYVPPGGGTFFTGSTGVATSADPWTTTVNVPSFAKAEVTESTLLSACAPNLLTCEVSTLTIPGIFPKLIITLRRDVSTIAKSAKISSARIYYDNPTTPDPRITYPYEVLPCTDTTWGPLPQAGIPCINKRTEFTKRTAPTPDWEGDWAFEIWAIDNGRYQN
jgi:hypothetical protein